MNQTLFVEKLSIVNDSHNIKIIKYDAQKLQTVMTGGIEKINPQGWIWMGAKWVTDILPMLTFLSKY